MEFVEFISRPDAGLCPLRVNALRVMPLGCPPAHTQALGREKLVSPSSAATDVIDHVWGIYEGSFRHDPVQPTNVSALGGRCQCRGPP
jgi:hypothetical protein